MRLTVAVAGNVRVEEDGTVHQNLSLVQALTASIGQQTRHRIVLAAGQIDFNVPFGGAAAGKILGLAVNRPVLARLNAADAPQIGVANLLLLVGTVTALYLTNEDETNPVTADILIAGA